MRRYHVFEIKKVKPWLLPFACAFFLIACVTVPESERRDRLKVVEPGADEPWPQFSTPAAQNFILNCEKVLEEAVKQLVALEGGGFPADSTLLHALNKLEILIDSLESPSGLYLNVHPDRDVRSAAAACEQRTAELDIERSLSRPLYDQLSSVPKKGLNKSARRYLKTTLEEFRRSGVDKDGGTRIRIRELNEQIVKIGQEFDRNIREDVRKVEASPAELDGLPQDFIDAHPVNEQGTVTLTTESSDYLPIMQYAHSDDLRLRLYKKYRRRGYPENVPVLKSLLKKRHELAQLLGYSTFADYITADQMIKSPNRVRAFIDRVNKTAKRQSEEDYQVMLDRLRQINPSATNVGDWQKDYLQNLIKAETYKVDTQAVRQYFSYPKVRDGIFELMETMFGVKVRPWPTQVWHPSVESFEIWDKGKLIGQFYLDMHPREGKFKHAAAFSVREGVRGVQTPIKALVANFPEGDESGALMEHEQVETLFHEFGHLMHGLFGGHQPWLKLTGISTEHDFVEAPSQMLEEWVWDPSTLKAFARNDQNQPIPGDMVRKLRASRDFGRALWARHQLFYAALSLAYHDTEPAEIELEAMMAELHDKYSPFKYVDGTHFYASFGHLEGYSALYYTYMWSLVIAADMFSEFEKEGLNNKDVARRFKQSILVPGGSKDADQLVRDFLGRPYNFEAFEKFLLGK